MLDDGRSGTRRAISLAWRPAPSVVCPLRHHAPPLPLGARPVRRRVPRRREHPHRVPQHRMQAHSPSRCGPRDLQPSSFLRLTRSLSELGGRGSQVHGHNHCQRLWHRSLEGHPADPDLRYRRHHRQRFHRRLLVRACAICQSSASRCTERLPTPTAVSAVTRRSTIRSRSPTPPPARSTGRPPTVRVVSSLRVHTIATRIDRLDEANGRDLTRLAPQALTSA